MQRYFTKRKEYHEESIPGVLRAYTQMSPEKQRMVVNWTSMVRKLQQEKYVKNTCKR